MSTPCSFNSVNSLSIVSGFTYSVRYVSKASSSTGNSCKYAFRFIENLLTRFFQLRDSNFDRASARSSSGVIISRFEPKVIRRYKEGPFSNDFCFSSLTEIFFDKRLSSSSNFFRVVFFTFLRVEFFDVTKKTLLMFFAAFRGLDRERRDFHGDVNEEDRHAS